VKKSQISGNTRTKDRSSPMRDLEKLRSVFFEVSRVIGLM